MSIDPGDIIPVSDLPRASAGTGDDIVGVQLGRAKLFPRGSIPLSARDEERLQALIAGQSTNAIYTDTLSDLQAITGSYEGQGAFVTNGDGNGQYRWTGSSWEFLRADTLSDKADRSELLTKTNETRTPFDSMVKVDATPILPVGYINSDGSIPVGLDITDGALLASFKKTNPSIRGIAISQIQSAIPDTTYLYDGAGPVVPLVVNDQRQVLLGINTENGQIVGSTSSAGGNSYAPAPLRDLSPSVVPTRSGWNHVLVYGQSLAVGSTSIPPINTTSKYQHLTFGAGPRSTKSGSIGANPGTNTAVPLFENTLTGDGGSNRGETPCSGLGNAFTTYAAEENAINPSDAVLFCSAPGHGEYTLAQLDMNSAWSQVLRDHVTEAKARADSAGVTYSVTALAWMQGESDTSTPYQQYYNGMVAFQAAFATFVRGITRQNFDPIFIMYQTPNNGASNLGGQISEAQINLCLNEPGFAFGGPIYHMQSTDGTHINNVSEVRVGWQFGRAVKQYLIDKKLPSFIRPMSAVRKGNTIEWRFEVPQAPLVIDTTSLPPTQDYGFRVNDSSGNALPITSVEVRDGNTVVITLTDASTASVVRYALDYLGTGTNWNNEETGNLRDSTPGKFDVLGQTYYRWHVAPHCRANIINLGS